MATPQPNLHKRQKVDVTSLQGNKIASDIGESDSKKLRARRFDTIYKNWNLTEEKLQSHFAEDDACQSSHGTLLKQVRDWPQRFLEKIATLSGKISDISTAKALLCQERAMRRVYEQANGLSQYGRYNEIGFKTLEVEQVLLKLKRAEAIVAGNDGRMCSNDPCENKAAQRPSIVQSPALHVRDSPRSKDIVRINEIPSLGSPGLQETPTAQNNPTSFSTAYNPQQSFAFSSASALFPSVLQSSTDISSFHSTGDSRFEGEDEFLSMVDFDGNANHHIYDSQGWQSDTRGFKPVPQSQKNMLALPSPIRTTTPGLNAKTAINRVSAVELAQHAIGNSFFRSTSMAKRKLESMRDMFEDGDCDLTADMDASEMRSMIEYCAAIESYERGKEDNRPRLVKQAKSQMAKLWLRERLRLEHGVEM
ncbi:hypothetical protein EJ05DRAFT_504646 [Pseudovirgaria hyperparasitica]|uniref:Uncharacterized protein n=1 Tax=Pseudovirgaria hyperparasitica TaxID=470096 RepID=A0A6A6VXR9_9PEZI|nr:uncharacterized protein EJ05DRAFT_504646 [Pseudovirgaria hyperparasitica]KAF2754051.1 hypothetical protein EJ05DRAFT_504646 [Pseudovirgaria hyperparasitica]